MFERICHIHTALSKYSLELPNLLQLTIYCIKYPLHSELFLLLFFFLWPIFLCYFKSCSWLPITNTLDNI